MFSRWFLFAFLCLVSFPAFAGKVAVVDFQRAVTETTEGKAAQDKLDTMYSTRKAEIDRMQADLEKQLADYQSRALILSEDARAATERDLGTKQQNFQQTYAQYQQEMQETYYQLLQGLDEKMRAMTEQIAKEKGYDVVLDRAAVVYMGGETVDMTDDLITRYNAQPH
jgi:outer membrane protein